MPKHATLSASGAHRWMNCPPSALIEAGLPESTSDAAEQGTAAHALAEHKLRRALKQRSKRPTSDWINDEMEQLTDEYATFVLEQVAAVKGNCPDPVVLVEQRLDFSHVVPGGFGTGDCALIAEPLLQIIDLKYGQGVLVEAEHNPQLMLHALGALRAFDALYEIAEVAVTIYQPRRSNISTWQTTVAELAAWTENDVAPRAALAAAGEGEFYPGSWCTFCKISATCRARAEANLALAKLEFRPPAKLDNSEISAVLSQLPELTKWACDVQDYALSLAVNQGKQWAGFKVVEGRSIRKYADEKEVAKAAQDAGYTDIFDRKLITLTAMERLMGKATFSEVLGDLVIKPAGKPMLAPHTDKRPALHIASAVTEFEAINDNHSKKAGK